MKLAYVLSRYPLLSETFILREMAELEHAGHHLTVFPLREVRRGPRHARVAALRAKIHRTGWLGCGLGTHARWIWRNPRRYGGTLAAVLWHNRSERRLLAAAIAYWPKAVAITDAMQRLGIDRIHAHYATHPALVGYIVERLAGIPYSFTAHAHDLYCHRAMLGEKLRRARLAVTISEFNRGFLERARAERGAGTPVKVIRCGVETGRYAGLKRRERGSGAGSDGGGRLRLLSVGSLQPYKGHIHLLAACARLRERGCMFECRIVGGGWLEAALRREIAKQGLENQVQLLGPRTECEVRSELAWAQVFVLPSVVDGRTGQMEGIPVALMEAMAAGLAVVASRLSGIPELVGAAEGLLTRPGDVAELAESLLRLRDPELRRRLGEAAQRKVRTEYELARNVRRLAAALAETQPAGAGRGAAA